MTCFRSFFYNYYVMSIILFFVQCLGFLVAGQEKGVCYKSVNGALVKVCCQYYYHNFTTGQCIACPFGFGGMNCKDKCDGDHYGQGCRLKCNCTHDRCDNVIGCVTIGTTADVTTVFKGTIHDKTDSATSSTTQPEDSNKSDDDSSKFTTVYLYLVVVAGLLLIVFIIFIFKYRHDRCLSYKTRCATTKDESSGTLSPPLLPTARVLPISYDYAEADEELYSDIRESLMIENCNRPRTRIIPADQRRMSKILASKYSTYNHLNYNGSLPNVCLANEYSSVLKGRIVQAKKLCKSESCLENTDKSTTLFYSEHDLKDIREDNPNAYEEVLTPRNEFIHHVSNPLENE